MCAYVYAYVAKELINYSTVYLELSMNCARAYIYIISRKRMNASLLYIMRAIYMSRIGYVLVSDYRFSSAHRNTEESCVTYFTLQNFNVRTLRAVSISCIQ
jgi:hypothetical protein